MKRAAAGFAIAALLGAAPFAACADAVDALKSFVQEAKTGRAHFSQTVTSPDGKKTKTSSGNFEFARPNHFRFAYTKPFEQLIVADGRTVWIYDADLNQVSSRAFSQALSATPAALLAGGDVARDFDLRALPSKDGADWVQATPRTKDGAFESMRIGFRGKQLAVVEITDSFAQRSTLTFTQLVTNIELPPQTFQFTVPNGADVLDQ
jgi:outer membrane lipoprotein carrier protein